MVQNALVDARLLAFVKMPAERKDDAGLLVRVDDLRRVGRPIRIMRVDRRVDGRVLHRDQRQFRILFGAFLQECKIFGRADAFVVFTICVVEQHKAVAADLVKARRASEKRVERRGVAVMVARHNQAGNAATREFAMQRHKIQRGVAVGTVFHEVAENQRRVRRDSHVAETQENFLQQGLCQLSAHLLRLRGLARQPHVMQI